LDIHKNARLTLRSREELVNVVLSGKQLASVARQFRVTSKTAGKWVVRYRLDGIDGLQDRSSRPLRSPTRLSEAVTSRVIELRLQHTPGYEIARRTAIRPASISRILRRAHLSRWRDLHPAPAVQRYEHAAC
jgi:transposase